MTPIAHASFSLTPHHESAYELKIAFLSEEGTDLSCKKFTFCTSSETQGEVLDVYSQNGCCSKPLFSPCDFKGVKAAAKLFASLENRAPTVVVLDLKDSQENYLNEKEIVEHETFVSKFYSDGAEHACFSSRAKKMYSVFQKHLPLDFVIFEGRLKHRLLHFFSDEESSYFLKKGQGAKDFCVCAEYFMNGFKLGHTAREIASQDFIHSVSKTPFHPFKKSTVWYPALYKDVYGVKGVFATTLKPVFALEGAFHEKSQITTLSVEMLQ